MGAIFLHTGWRTAGTWLWTRMREHPDVMGFYEPLNEGLASIGRADIAQFSTDSWASHHPRQQRSYYDEFMPFVRPWRRGVKGYRPDYALDGWFGSAHATPDGLRAYVASLADYAHAHERIGVFKFTRSLGRLPWMVQTFPDVTHVVVVCNPFDQWRSAWHQAMRHVNPYFLIMPWLVLHRNARSRAIAAAAAALGVAPIDLGPGRIQQQYDRALPLVAAIEPEDAYRAFLVTWLLGTVDALRYGELVVDLDVLDRDERYRRHLERAFATRAGLPVDFGDFDATRRVSQRGIAHLLDLERAHADARRAIASASHGGEAARQPAERAIQILDRSLAPGYAGAELRRQAGSAG
jgi:hypothetical protein